jgi:hypothetical protein
MNALSHHNATVLVRLTAPEKRLLVRIAKAGDMRPAEIACKTPGSGSTARSARSPSPLPMQKPRFGFLLPFHHTRPESTILS